VNNENFESCAKNVALSISSWLVHNFWSFEPDAV